MTMISTGTLRLHADALHAELQELPIEGVLDAVTAVEILGGPCDADDVMAVLRRVPHGVVVHVTAKDDQERLVPVTVHDLAVGGLVPLALRPQAATDARSTDAGTEVTTTPDLPTRLAELMSQVLGQTVGVDDHFFDLGGTSLQAARLYALLYRDFDVDLPLASLLEAPTPTALAELVTSLTRGPSTIVPIRAEGSRTPVFVCHGAVGNVLFVTNVAAGISPDRPVLALQAPYLDGRRPTERTVEQLALRYVAAVRAVQPEGPYHLVGYSFGGSVVVEMARHLHLDGHEVGLVALGDTVAPGAGVTDAPLREATSGRLALHRKNLAGMTAKDFTGYIRRLTTKRLDRVLGRVVWRLLPPGRALPPAVRPSACEMHSRHLGARYRPSPVPVPLTMFRAMRGHGSPDHGWADLAPLGLEIVPFDCTHLELRDVANGHRWGQQIERLISERGT